MIDFDMKKMGQRIKELRNENGLSQKELAEKIGVAQNTIAQYEKGIVKTSLEVLVQLTNIFEVSADYLLGREEF